MSVDPQQSRSVPDLLSDLLRETTELFRTEGKLIRAEISDKVAQIQLAGGSLVAGAICLLVSLIVLSGALVVALGKIMDPAWAALLVGVVIAVIGVVLLAAGKKNLEAVNLAPERSLGQLQKDGQLVKEQTR
ncbi:phage holin family protein [Aureimonas phyllosphaerae]|uniref:Protein-S-isoprenylcysteine O-methyltransferase Ste14 n=1 Tax=Aureimonas phyllosphaerae TaxID=1166078 RepID=A0A7W6FW48_9HYPH|nr:phage holin family protein [Aureimonas phyllosphaerae]MBB3936707.1 protein-S-isoprenylcysteine O-methyltransferase Ste14 [Aureimonas phyllosphaerae]MBB3960430.1 protein-S-isoprenylcysteine O-methyltransferase Ste14 [Aureimonas phyllosphaerae]SFF22898.1 Putative Holin-X, holin superfamily III [Aureimonas phyllosphaerae]